MRRLAVALAALTLVTGCSNPTEARDGAMVAVAIASRSGVHRFRLELARTAAVQARGLMFRRHIDRDAGMVFAPFPPDGTGPAVATFWMKDTPAPLDILFVRPDGHIANIVADATPLSDTYLMSNGPVGAVLEIGGGRAAELGIAAGDRVTWPQDGPGSAPPPAAMPVAGRARSG